MTATKVVEAYCVKCKARRIMQHAQLNTTKNGIPAYQGSCGDCGAKMNKFLSKDAAVANGWTPPVAT